MKLINNQNILLIDEITTLLDTHTNISISCDYFTAYALFDMLENFKRVNSIRILLSYDANKEEDFQFLYSSDEHQLNLQLDRKYRIHQVINLIKDKVEIRKGSLANQHVLIVENDGTCLLYTSPSP